MHTQQQAHRAFLSLSRIFMRTARWMTVAGVLAWVAVSATPVNAQNTAAPASNAAVSAAVTAANTPTATETAKPCNGCKKDEPVAAVKHPEQVALPPAPPMRQRNFRSE